MKMKDHILAALREQFDRWEELFASMSAEEIIAPQFELDWSIKDVMAHLWAWQQTSVARVEGGLDIRAPEFPGWVAEAGEDWEDKSDQVNALIFERNYHKSWPEIHQNWKEGFLRFIEVGSKISERDLLDGEKYPWLKGYSLAFVLIASYNHHQEHIEKLLAWPQRHGN